jgi:biotin carboxylase
VPVARGRVARTLNEALQLVEEVGYPIIAKPDIGVGAASTSKIHSRSELEAFFAQPPLTDIIFEEFIEGAIETFDGLADRDAQVVFCSTMVYNEGVMESVNNQLDFWYVVQRDIPADLEHIGRKLVKMYGVRERFFHFEFFRTPEGRLVALEVNMRPPGGMTTDMWDYANDIDIYREYAHLIANNRFEANVTHPYYCAYLGRRYQHAYAHTIEDIRAAFPGSVVHAEPISGIFAAAIGDYGILVRSPEEEGIEEMVRFVFERQA